MHEGKFVLIIYTGFIGHKQLQNNENILNVTAVPNVKLKDVWMDGWMDDSPDFHILHGRISKSQMNNKVGIF